MDSIQQLRRRAQNGDADALFSLRKRHDEGIHGVEQDLPIARQFYERATELGHVDAMVNLAILLVDGGVGVDKDAVGAKAHFERAAGAGDVDAITALADHLITGEYGVRRELDRARQLLEKVASTSANPLSKTRSAHLLLSEDFVSDVNRGRAIELLQSAASETQFDVAHHELAILCDLSNAEERFKPPVRIRPTGTAKFHFKAAATGSKAGVNRGSIVDKVIAAGSQCGFVLKQTLRVAAARSKTCLLVTLGGAGRGKTCTMNSVRGMPFCREHVPTEMADVCKFILDPGTRGLDDDLMDELDFNENSFFANATRNNMVSDEGSAVNERSGFRTVADTVNISPLHSDVIERVRRSVMSNAIPRGFEGAVVRCWDMAGQSVYEMAHSLVIRYANVIAFVVDLQRVSDEVTRESEVSMLCYWMQLAYVVVANPSKVRVVIVGTRMGLCSPDVLDILESSLQQQLGMGVYDLWIRQSGDRGADHMTKKVISIENSETDTNPEGSGLEELEKRVKDAADAVVNSRDVVPLRWFALVDKLERSGKKFISKTELEKLSIGFPGFDHLDDRARKEEVVLAIKCFASIGQVILFEVEEEGEYYVFMNVNQIISLLGQVTAPERRLEMRLSQDEMTALREGQIYRESLFKLWNGYDEDEMVLVLKLLCRFDMLVMLDGDEAGRDGAKVVGVPALLPSGWDDFNWSCGDGELDFSMMTRFRDAVPLGLIGMLVAYLRRVLGHRNASSASWSSVLAKRLYEMIRPSQPVHGSRVNLVRANAAMLSTEDGSRVFVGFQAAERQLCWKFRGKNPISLAKRCISKVDNLLTQRMNVERKHVILSDCDCAEKNGVEIKLSSEWWASHWRGLESLSDRCKKCFRIWSARELADAQVKSYEAQPAISRPERVMPKVRYDVFVSHAGPDKLTLARPISQELERHGLHCFLDMDRLQISADTAPDLMDRAMAEAYIGIFVLSPQSAARKWTMRELRHFLRRNKVGGRDKPVILPIFARLNLQECETVYDENSEHRRVLEREKFFTAARQIECSTEDAKAAMRGLTKFSGVERKRIGGGADLSYAELLSETVRRVLQEVKQDIST